MEKLEQLSDWEAHAKRRYQAVQEKMEELRELNVDCTRDLQKIKDKVGSMGQEKISLALVGAFSDGKTSVIAGLFGEELEGMQISVDESTDEIQVHEPNSPKIPCRIVDTPGLFGTKEKQRPDGVVLLGEIAKRYLAEAHMLLYVVESKNPIKDSHKDTLRWIMKDLQKTDRMIFVINKMDDVADTSDEEEFLSQATIKKEAVREKLRELVGVRADDAAKVRIVCIAADPDRRGMDFWKEHTDVYEKRSHIADLEGAIAGVLQEHPAEEFFENVAIGVCKDILGRYIEGMPPLVKEKEEERSSLEESVSRRKEDFQETRERLLRTAGECREELDAYRKKLIGDIYALTLESSEEFIVKELGRRSDMVGEELVQRLNRIIEKYFSRMEEDLGRLQRKLQAQSDVSSSIVVKVGRQAMSLIKFVPSATMVDFTKTAIFLGRDLVGKIGIAIKFKPWQVTKIARFAPGVVGFLEIGTTVADLVERNERDEMLKKLRNELRDMITGTFHEIQSTLQGDALFKNYAPDFLKVQADLEAAQKELRDLKDNMRSLVLWVESAKELQLGLKGMR